MTAHVWVLLMEEHDGIACDCIKDSIVKLHVDDRVSITHDCPVSGQVDRFGFQVLAIELNSQPELQPSHNPD